MTSRKPLLLAPLVAALIAAGPVRADGGDGEAEGKIAFISSQTGSFDVWVMNADGSNQVNLTPVPGGENWTEWSPDGRQILFTRGPGFFASSG